jgi:phage terminase small subunit
LPALTNPRQERFAQELSKGKTGDEAYVLAGYKRNKDNASRLKANESILGRLAELQGRAAKRAEVTVESLIAEAEAVRKAAFEAGQFSPAIAAIKEKGILSGNRVERRENINRDAGNLSDDELEDIALGRGEGAAETASGSTVFN